VTRIAGETPPASDWFDREEPTRNGLVAELQRIRRRTFTRPWRVIAVALVITTGIGYEVETHKPAVEAEVVLALSEGTMAGRSNGLPVEELRGYVGTVLLPDAKLQTLVEQRDLYRLRKRLGEQYAIDELRSQLEIEVWKNTFTSDEFDDENSRSARIGLAVTDTDPDRAYALARDLAAIVIETASEKRAAMTKQLVDQIGVVHDREVARLEEIARVTSQKEQAADVARATGQLARAQAIDLELAQLWQEGKSANHTLAEIAQSRDSVADRISAAGLDVTVSIVEEHKPQPSDHRSFALVLVIVVVGFGAVFGAALVLGAFDARVHDTDDIERLGLAVLGHLPGFPGDEVGSLEARGASRRRVPSFSRWRWLR